MSGEGEGEIPANVLQALRSTFAKFDEDGKGSLDREQFQRMVQSKGPTPGDELYNFFDHDEEGRISLEQFLAGYPKAVKAQSEGTPTSPEPSGEEATSGPAQHHSRRNLHQRAPPLTDFDVATLAKLGQSLEELQGENLRLTGQIEIQTEQIRAAAEGHLAYTQEIERLQKLLDEADMTHSRLNDQLKQRQDSLTATSKDLSVLQEQYDTVHTLLKESQSASSSAQQEIEELNKRIRKLDTVLKDAEADFQARLTAALKEKDSKIEQLTKDIDTASKANGHSIEITNLKFQLDQLQHKYDLRKKQVEELRLNENFYEEENKRLQQELDNLQSSLSPSSGKLASERGVRSKVLERSTSLGKPAVTSLKHERGVSTPLASGGVVMKPVISVTPSTPVNLKRSKSGSNPSQMAAIPLNLPGGTTGHSPRSESSDGNGGISGGGSLSPSSSFSNPSASGSSTAPKSTPALMNLASSTPSSSSTTNTSTSSAKRARRLSGSLTDDLEIAAPHFAKALSKQYLGDKKERPGDDDVEPLAGLSTGPNSARSSMEIPSPRVLEENLQLQAQIDSLKALVTKLELDVQKHKHSESDILGKLSDLEAENSDLKEKEAQLNAELHKKDILYRETAAESDSLQKRSSESALKFTQDLERLKRQLKDEQARLQELEATCNDFRDSNLKLERQYSELLSKYNSLEEESIEKGNKLTQVHAALEAQKAREDFLNDELETLRHQLAESKDASKSFEETGEATRDELGKAQASMTTLAQKLQNAENGLRQQQVLQGKLAELENEKEMWDRANSDFEATVHTQKQTITALQQKIADLELQLSQQTSKAQETEVSSSAALKEAQSKIESLTQQLSNQMETAAQLSDSQASLQQITESFNNLELEKKVLEQQLETVKSQHSSLSAAIELERSSQASRVQELEEEILQLKMESEAALDDLNKKMAAAIETERSSKANQIEELTNTIRRMEEEEEARSASEQQLESSNTESRRVVDSLQKLVADLNEQLKQKDSTLEDAVRQVELVQQDTEEVKADGAKRVYDLESERAKQAEHIEGLERKIERLKEELNTAQSSLLKQLETTSLESRQLEESSKLAISELKEEIKSKEATVEEAKREVEHVRHELEEVKAESSKKISEITSTQANSEQIIADLKEELESKTNATEEATLCVERVQSELEETKAESFKKISDIESERNKQTKHIEELERTIEKLKEETETAQLSLAQHLRSFELETRRSEDSSAQLVTELKQQLQLKDHAIEEVNRQLEYAQRELADAKAESSKKMSEIESDRNMQTERIEDLERTMAKLKEEAQTAQTALVQHLETSGLESRRVEESSEQVISELKEEIKSKETTAKEAKREVEHVQHELEEVKAESSKKIAEIELECAKQIERIEELERTLEQAKLDSEEVIAAVNKQLEVANAETIRVEQQAEQRIAAVQKDLRLVETALESANLEVQRAQSQFETLQAQRERVSTESRSMADLARSQLQDLFAQFHTEPDDDDVLSATQRELEEVQHELEVTKDHVVQLQARNEHDREESERMSESARMLHVSTVDSLQKEVKALREQLSDTTGDSPHSPAELEAKLQDQTILIQKVREQADTDAQDYRNQIADLTHQLEERKQYVVEMDDLVSKLALATTKIESIELDHSSAMESWKLQLKEAHEQRLEAERELAAAREVSQQRVTQWEAGLSESQEQKKKVGELLQDLESWRLRCVELERYRDEYQRLKDETGSLNEFIISQKDTIDSLKAEKERSKKVIAELKEEHIALTNSGRIINSTPGSPASSSGSNRSDSQALEDQIQQLNTQNANLVEREKRALQQAEQLTQRLQQALSQPAPAQTSLSKSQRRWDERLATIMLAFTPIVVLAYFFILHFLIATDSQPVFYS